MNPIFILARSMFGEQLDQFNVMNLPDFFFSVARVKTQIQCCARFAVMNACLRKHSHQGEI